MLSEKRTSWFKEKKTPKCERRKQKEKKHGLAQAGKDLIQDEHGKKNFFGRKKNVDSLCLLAFKFYQQTRAETDFISGAQNEVEKKI
ncbi:hypothetical protein HZH66_006694 [Vespula vulgaris]|uniref:Uncharacterized protein n=1 Tax=Vespula vulgaris TaxID=7454 RepID=A0A834K2D5_VESVU|nr:hypothetical protein HZH66_006694 [Vespula vulgaris]